MSEGFLFEPEAPERPLADRMRPETLEDVAGQEHLLGPGMPLRKMVDSGKMFSFILWGPPGCGKTTLARILAGRSSLHFAALSAVFSGVADLRKAFDEAARRREEYEHGNADEGDRPAAFAGKIEYHRGDK